MLTYLGNAVVDGVNDAIDASGTEGGDLGGLVKNLINAAIVMIGIVAVGMMIFGGVQLQLSQGDSAKVKKAKDTIMYGIIGLVVAILAFAIVNFVLASLF